MANSGSLHYSVDYPDHDLDRLSTALRPIIALPIMVVLAAIQGLLVIPAGLMIVARAKYPRWWFDFNRELLGFGNRVAAYLALMDDEYPATDAPQHVHVAVEYPDVEHDLNRWMPLVKWLLAIPHYVVLAVLWVGVVFAVLGSWAAILITGRYPRSLFTYVEGVLRWTNRVVAYAALMVTDVYPPFRLAA